jgi:hypothetical protein
MVNDGANFHLPEGKEKRGDWTEGRHLRGEITACGYVCGTCVCSSPPASLISGFRNCPSYANSNSSPLPFPLSLIRSLNLPLFSSVPKREGKGGVDVRGGATRACQDRDMCRGLGHAKVRHRTSTKRRARCDGTHAHITRHSPKPRLRRMARLRREEGAAAAAGYE